MSDLGDEAAERNAVTADADLPEEIMPDEVPSGGPGANDVPDAAASEEDQLSTAIRVAREGRVQEAVLLFMEILDESPTHPPGTVRSRNPVR